jgi:branched-chain amino acid transport system permease protein
MNEFFQQLYNGMAISSIYLLIALGITLIYGLTRLVNFAQGELVALGAFLAYGLRTTGLPFVLVVVTSVLIVVIFSQVLYFGLFRRTLQQPLNGFLISIGLIGALESAYALIWGTNLFLITPPFSHVWKIGGVYIDQPRFVIIMSVVFVTLVLFFTLERSQIGKGIRATAENAIAARVLGVPTRKLMPLTFAVGSALAALSGALLGSVYPFNAYSGEDLLLAGFAVAIIGGLGNVWGAVVAAICIGMAQTLGTAYVSSEWSSGFALAVMILIIIWRPHGLFRGTEGAGTSQMWRTSTRRQQSRVNLDGKVGPSLLVTFVAAAIAAPWVFHTAEFLSIASYGAILALAAYSLWLVFNYSGVFSIAQAAFMGIGAYSTGFIVSHSNIGFWPQVAIAAVLAAAVACVIGIVSFRTSGSYLLILLFAFVELIVLVMTNWVYVTGGSEGLISVATPRPFGGEINFSSDYALYFLIVGCLTVTIVMISVLAHTNFGQRLITVRDNETLASSLGLNPLLYRLAAFALGGAIAGVAGVLYLYQQLYIEPSLFDIFPGITIALIVVLGGNELLCGPVIGAIVVTFLPYLLRLGPNESTLAYGLVLVATIVLMPSGLAGKIQQLFNSISLKRASTSITRAMQEEAK